MIRCWVATQVLELGFCLDETGPNISLESFAFSVSYLSFLTYVLNIKNRQKLENIG